MSQPYKRSIFRSIFFWLIFLSFIVSLLVMFVSPYLFESFNDLTLRLLVSFSTFFGTVMMVMMYSLFVKDEIKQKLKEKNEERKITKEQSSAVAKNVQNLKTRFVEAMRIVKSSSIYKSGNRAGYELPWYLMVGAEKEGKTSILENSGLDFPLNINYDKDNNEEGVSTTSFQWYFAEHAIFIDMPGNYIDTKNRPEDEVLWQTFLRLFSKKRWKRPINGIVFTVSVDTLLDKSAKELEQYAKDLRDRFDEISHAFMSNIPIYLLVSKTDKIVGFNEFFSDLSDKEKTEVLGVTFDDKLVNIETTVIQPELEDLLKRLNSNVLDKVNREWEPNARAKIVLFGNELSTLFDKLNVFVDQVFSQTRYRKPLMLRGIYLTAVPSAHALATSQEFEQSSVSQLSGQKGMFIQNLLSDIIFPEADIVKMDTRYKKSQRIKHLVALSASIIIVALTTVFWIQDFNGRLDHLDEAQASLDTYVESREEMTTKTDFKASLKTINQIYELKNLNSEDMSKNFWKIAYFKVEQNNIIIENHYKESLEHLFLPRIAQMIEKQIQASKKDYDLIWESTKAYLMLSNEARRNDDFLKAWMSSAWSHLYPNMNDTQNELNMHFSNLLAYGFTPYVSDKKILADARKKLLSYGHEALVYKELKDEAALANLESFRFSKVLGSYASAFDGVDYEIPGFFTKHGFESIIINRGKSLIKDLVSNNWVVGYTTDLSDDEIDQMYSKVQNYYFIEYKKYWMAALSALKVPKYKSISEINNQLTVLTSGTSPIMGVLEALKENTDIYTPAEKLQMKAKESAKLGGQITAQALKKAQKITRNTSVENIRNYFNRYNRLINKEIKPTPKLATAMLKLNNVYQEMTAIYGSVTPEKDAYSIVADRVLGRHAPIVMQRSALPTPVDRWFKQALKNDWNYILLRTKKYINMQYDQEVLGYYRNKIEGRYPLVSGSKKNEIRTQDFEDFFKINGILDSFYQNYISTFVKMDLNRGTFKYRSIDGSNMYISKSFMNAQLLVSEIRKTLFDDQGDVLDTTFYMKPKSLGRNLARMAFHYDEHYISYEHGPIKSRRVVWPARSLNNVAKFNMFDLQKDKVVEISKEGEWAFFKLIDEFNVKGYKKRRGSSSVEIDYKKKRYNGSFIVSGNAAKLFTKDNPLKKFKLRKSL